MKALSEYIKESIESVDEALDTIQYNKIRAMRVRQKKEDLVAAKRSLSKIDRDELTELASKAYNEIGQYNDPDELFDAYDSGNLEYVKKIADEVKTANSGDDIDFDTLLDVIELLAAGRNIAQAVTILAKKI